MTEKNEVSAPSVDELEAKSSRLVGDVDEAKAALEVAKQTFADAAQNDPTAVESLLELATAVKTAEATVSVAQRAVSKNQADIDGIRYDESMAGVTDASVSYRNAVQPAAEEWFDANSGLVEDFAIDTLTTISQREPSGAITTSVKPSGENMPKRPSAKRGGNGERGPRGTRTVTVNGQSMSCREYVALCGTDASPAAQADLDGSWDGSPVSYTNEAKRLAAKRGDTFA